MPMPGQPKGGRPHLQALEALRDRIETLYLNGQRATAISRLLAAPENTTPISLTVAAIENHITAIRKRWAAETGPDMLDAQRHELLALATARERTAAAAAQRFADSNLGVGYLNVSLKAQERRSKLLGLDVSRTELTGRNGGPVVVAPEPTWDEDMPLEEQARRLRLEADAIDMRLAMEKTDERG